jgi:hypothetical protein
MQCPGSVWRAILMVVSMTMVGCQARRPDFVTRVQENCVAGDQWACDLLEGPMPAEDIITPGSVKDDPPCQ